MLYPTAVFWSLAAVAQVPPPDKEPINIFSEPPILFAEPPLPQALYPIAILSVLAPVPPTQASEPMKTLRSVLAWF